MTDTYREQVVGLGDDASKMLYVANKMTWPNRDGLYGEIEIDNDHFRGMRFWGIGPLLDAPEPRGLVFTQEDDGIGTKVLVSQRVNNYKEAANDLFAMATDDAAAKGFEPAIITTVLDVNQLKGLQVEMSELASGAVHAANRSRVAMFGGETAVLGDLIGGYQRPTDNLQFIWSATVHGVGHKERLITGRGIRPGMSIVGLAEPGFRSNGISKVRDALEAEHGEYWHLQSFETNGSKTTLGKAVLHGSVIYTPVLVDANGGHDLRRDARAKLAGVAHITGGGLWSKLGDMLDVSGFGADIEMPFEPSEALLHVQKITGMTDYEAYGTFPMGMGMLAVTYYAEDFMAVARDHNVDARVIGGITEQSGIQIRSAGAVTPGMRLKSAA